MDYFEFNKISGINSCIFLLWILIRLLGVYLELHFAQNKRIRVQLLRDIYY